MYSFIITILIIFCILLCTCGHAAEMGEEAKHSKNDEACALREWTCIPLVVEVFGGCGNEAINVLQVHMLQRVSTGTSQR